MNATLRWTRLTWVYCLCCIVVCVGVGHGAAEKVDIAESIKTEAQLKIEEKAKEEKKPKPEQPAAKVSPEEIAQLDFPEDTSLLMTAKELRITGNSLVTTEEILSSIPSVYNSSGGPLQEAESVSLYDFKTVREIIETPGQGRQISARTIKGLTKCIRWYL